MMIQLLKTPNHARRFLIAAMATMAIVLGASVGGGWASADEHGTSPTVPPAPTDVPPGQLVRRGFTGTVAGIAGDLSSFELQTKWGAITVGLSSSTIINKPPEKDVGPTALAEGDRVGVLLNRPPVDEDVSGLPDTGAFRKVIARRVTIVPGKANRSHVTALVTAHGNGKVKFVGDDGDEHEIDGDLDVDDGDEITLITQSTDDGGTEASGFSKLDAITERLTQLADRLQNRFADKLAALQLNAHNNRVERLQAVFERTVNKFKDRVTSALERAKSGKPDRPNKLGRPDSSGDGDSGTGRGQGGSKR